MSEKDNQISKMDAKIDRIESSIGDIKITLAEQHITLQEHMKRSALNEQAIELIQKELKPVQKHVILVSGAFKLFGIICTLAMAIGGIAELIALFMK